MRNGSKQALEEFVRCWMPALIHGHLELQAGGSLRNEGQIKYSIQQGFGYQVDHYVQRVAVSDAALQEFQARWGHDEIFSFSCHERYFEFLKKSGVPARNRGGIPHFMEHTHANEQKFRLVKRAILSFGHRFPSQFTATDLNRATAQVTNALWDECLVAWVTRGEAKALGQTYRGDTLASSLAWYKGKGVGLLEKGPGGAHVRVV